MSINSGLMSSATDEWATPQGIFDELNREFRFTLDPCATAENAKCERFYTRERDGLQEAPWTGERVFMNPPYAETSATGSRRLTTRLVSPIPWLSACSPPAPIRPGGIPIACGPMRFGSSVGVSDLGVAMRPSPLPSWCSTD